MGTGGTAEKILMNYSGSTALSFLCELTNLSIDQINFITCQIFALCFSVCMKKWIRDPQLKLYYTLVCGLSISLFCFGNQIFHIVTSAGVGYLLICTHRGPSMPWLVLSACMFYLSSLHLQRQFFDELGSYTLDITGPLMVLTQKVTSLAFSIQDAVDQKKKEDSGTEMQKKYAVVERPTFLEYWSFVFQFQSMLAGPLVLFKDFREFIHTDEFPSPFVAVVTKIGASALFAVVFIKVTPVYSIDRVKESEFLWDTPFLYRMFYVTVATMMERAKYYHAWILADAVCNASGLGYDSKSEKWDLVTNVNALEFELGLNLKESLDCWNKGTMKWLRYVIYERVSPKWRTVATYAMSAIWHGFYPGYYLTFLSGAMFTSAGRQIRKTIRPFFLQDKGLKVLYDFGTWLTTRFAIAYVTFSFVILDFTPSILLFMRLFFCFHFAAAGAMFALPKLSNHLKGKEKKDTPATATCNTSTKPVVHEDEEGKAPVSTTEKKPNTPATKSDKILADDTQFAVKPVRVPESSAAPPSPRQQTSHHKDNDTTPSYGPKLKASHHLEQQQPNSRHHSAPATPTKDLNILSQHEFPEIASYLSNNDHHKPWSSWTSQSINHGSTPVQLKTG